MPLLATQLSFAAAQAEALRAYERGFVKEGVGAGGCAIAAHLLSKSGAWLCSQTEQLLDERRRFRTPPSQISVLYSWS